ncbi:hypothetical protein PR202_ga17106 [Eleusine coracana subsp. coracana]|uniref:Proteasome activator subunit 4 n=1 Tax=Eleusine coracana subsp. coracana TaxID=191504 RepID=A0AAV5CPQ4_ELECO|nr:hypothetical protein PR202_ga17106 [Eleusine coracana subsp. coracana]
MDSMDTCIPSKEDPRDPGDSSPRPNKPNRRVSLTSSQGPVHRAPGPPIPTALAFTPKRVRHRWWSSERRTDQGGMHLYNAWLPPAVAEAARGEAAAFAGAVRAAAAAWRPGDPDSAYATLKWISVFDLFFKAKSDVAPEDVQALVELGLEIFNASQDKFVVQIKWGGLLVRILRKHGKRLSLGVQWRPLYDTLIRTHFKRNMGPEGWKVRQQHFETVTSLVRASRNFFPEGAAAEIWSEFRFYHPSNGGRWTCSLERFLRYLVVYFEKRLQHEQFESVNEKHDQFYLGKEERAAFVKAILKLDRGQYSKDDSLAETVSIATSILSYVEPALVLPFVATNFQLALETTTATHQLKNAVTSVAFSGRALLLCSLSSSQFDDSSVVDSFSDLIVASLSNALLGMDANDPPKTIATMQLIGSIFSNLATVGGTDDVPAFLQAATLSNWLDEFFSRLFSVLQNLESSSPINEGYQTSFMSGTFLVEDSPYYFCMLEILLGKLSKPLFIQSLKRIAKFVNANILPGATSEVGLLCCACVHSYPEEASVYLLKPILTTIMSSFEGTPTTGYIGRVVPDKTYKKAALSPALETALDYYLRVLALAISYAGPVLLKYREELMHIITSAFQSPSWKVNGAGDHLLRSLLGNLVSYYPIDQYKPFNCQPISKIIEPWGCSKAHQDRESEMLNFPPKWHEPRDEKEHLKVTLLRINSALHGVMSCLPEIRPSYRDGSSNQVEPMFFIAGSAGSTIGSSEMREKAAEFVHIACRYLLKERADDSILLTFVVRVIDALINYGSLEYDEWSGHVQAWNLESAAIIEPPCNFIIPFHTQGKKRYRTNADVCPSELMVNLMTDLLDLSLHNYETVRLYAGRSLTKVLKRWPSLISNCVLTLTEIFRNPKAPEHAVLGSCSILSSLTVLRHLTTDPVSLSSFIMGILERYNLMANRVLLLLILASRSESIYSQILAETAGHFLRNLKSQLPHSRMLAISALNTMLQGLPHKTSSQDSQQSLDHPEECNTSLTGQILNEIIQQDGFMTETLNSLSHVHIISDNDNSSKGSYGASSFQSGSDKAITYFYFDFSASWPRTPSWISLVGGNTFYSSFARIFKRLIQQCGMPVMSSLQTALEEFLNSKERSRQCVAAEAMAGMLHSDITGNLEPGNNWLMNQLHKILLTPSVESVPEWAACIRYAVTGKERSGTRAPFLRQKVLDCLCSPVPQSVGTSVLAKRYSFLSVALIEISPPKMSPAEEQYHVQILDELLDNMSHSSAQGQNANSCLGGHDLELEFLHGHHACRRRSWSSKSAASIDLTHQIEEWRKASVDLAQLDSTEGRQGAKEFVGAGGSLPGSSTRSRRPRARSAPRSPDLMKKGRPVGGGRAAAGGWQRGMRGRRECAVRRRVRGRGGADGVASSIAGAGRWGQGINSAQFRGEGSESSMTCGRVEKNDSELEFDFVREAIGVAMCVACSNLRLSGSFSPGGSPKEVSGDVSMTEQTGNEYWSNQLTDGANELSISIQNSTQSKKLESTSDSANDNGVDHIEEANVKRMETIFHFMIASLKSGRASVLLDLIIGFVYPVLSLQETSNKDLSLPAKSAFELLKWRILHRPFLENAIAAILSSVSDPNWRTRSALLSYLRTFTYSLRQLKGSRRNADNEYLVRDHAAGVLASLMKGEDKGLSKDFRERSYAQAQRILDARRRNSKSGHSVATIHGAVLALTASVLSVPYDMPSWLPAHVTLLARFVREPPPIRSTVTKAIAEFKRTHADTWIIQKEAFTEDQLEVLRDTSSSSSYFA